jgi:hypothetical protein
MCQDFLKTLVSPVQTPEGEGDLLEDRDATPLLCGGQDGLLECQCNLQPIECVGIPLGPWSVAPVLTSHAIRARKGEGLDCVAAFALLHT